jgi:hypothetical protein
MEPIGMADIVRRRNLQPPRHEGANKPASFQCQQHLMNGRRGHLKEPLDIGLRRWTPVHQRTGVDKCKILSLSGREIRLRITWRAIHRCP